MAIQAGTYRLGPGTGTLSVRTGRRGAASKAGHDLLIEVTSWDATLAVAEDPADTSIELSADGGSLRVREGTGGMQALGDDDKANIQQTIDDEVLRRQGISFRSTRVQPGGDGRLHAEGDLTLLGNARPIAFDVVVAADGAITASATVKQSTWDIKPYSALFGALKVADEVEVSLTATLQAAQSV